MKRNTILSILTLAAIAPACVSCDQHKDFVDTSMKVGHIVCSDGTVVPFETCESKGKTPVGVVFYVDKENQNGISGYAVYMNDCEDVSFADSLGVKQNTSADITALDGNSNTYNIYSTAAVTSSMASKVFNLWCYGQSAFVPSVAELKLLSQTKETVNQYIKKCGGTPISDDPDQAWVWSSTEVEGQEAHKAWLYSLLSGSMLETPKDQNHKIRPIIAIY